MRSAIILSAIALVQGVCGFFPGQIPATPAGVFRGGSLVKRQEVCDPKSGLSCRAGEYCVIIDGTVGCCPEGKVCGSVRTCVDHDTSGCENGGTVDGALCCDAGVPYCNVVGNTQFCDAVKQETVTKTITSTTTVCHYTATVTPNCSSPPAGNTTTTYVIPTLTPYPSDKKPVIPTLAPYPSDEEPEVASTTEIPNVLLVAENKSYTPTNNTTATTNVTSTIPKQSEPAMEGSAVASSVSFSVVLGGFAIAFVGALLG